MRLLVLLAVLVLGYFLTRMLYHHVVMDKMLNQNIIKGCRCGCVGGCKCPVGCACGCRNRLMGDHMGDHMGGTCHECN